MSTVDPAEFEKLKAEVAELRDLVHRVITLGRNLEGEITSTSVHADSLSCKSFDLRDGKSDVRGHMSVDGDGPYFALFGPDDKTRVSMRVYEDQGRVSLFGADLKATVQIFTDSDGHGNVMVHSPGGVPRAGMKGISDSGVISVCAPDGTPRAVMHSGDGEGEIGILNPALEVIARLTTTPEGGSVGILRNDGKRAIVMIPSAQGNGLLVYKPDGGEGVTLLTADTTSMILCGDVRADTGAPPAVAMIGMPDGSGTMRICEKSGSPAVTLSANGEGGVMEIHAVDSPGTPLRFSVVKGGGHIGLNHGAGNGRVLLAASQHGATILAGGGDTEPRDAVLQVTESLAALLVSRQGEPKVALGAIHENGEHGLLLTNPDNSPALTLRAREEGGLLTVHGSDGITLGGLIATESGGQLSIFNDLGIERATLHTKLDGGVMNLKWGGTSVLTAVATEVGGAMLVSDPAGNTVASLPEHNWETGTDTDSE